MRRQRDHEIDHGNALASAGITATLIEIMGRASKSNLPQDVPLKWNVEKAAQEFGLSIQTLRKALNKNSAEPDADGCYSTRAIAGAVHGGALSEEKLRTQRQLTRKFELQNAITVGDVLDRAEIAKGLSMVADAMSSRIMSSDLPRNAKEDILNDLSTVPLILENVAHAQSKLSRGNGSRPEEE